MRENSHPPEPHEEAVPPGAGMAAGGHAPASFADPDNVLPSAAGQAPAEVPVARRRTRMIWLLAGAMAIVAGVTASAIVRKLQTDYALSRVARVAAMPPTDVATRDFPLAGAAGTTADAGAMPDAGPHAGTTAVVVPAPLPNESNAGQGIAAGAAGAAGAAALLAHSAPATASAGRPEGAAAPDKDAVTGSVGRPGGAGATAAEPQAVAATNPVQASQAVPPASNEAEEGTGSRAANPAAARSAATKAVVAKNRIAKSGVAKNGLARDRVAKSGAAKKSAARRAARRAAGEGDTFKRCPPLGRKGAVMCRWHICNGAAGKEAACRPYLERAP